MPFECIHYSITLFIFEYAHKRFLDPPLVISQPLCYGGGWLASVNKGVWNISTLKQFHKVHRADVPFHVIRNFLHLCYVDQSGSSIQILLEPCDTFFIKLRLYFLFELHSPVANSSSFWLSKLTTPLGYTHSFYAVPLIGMNMIKYSPPWTTIKVRIVYSVPF